LRSPNPEGAAVTQSSPNKESGRGRAPSTPIMDARQSAAAPAQASTRAAVDPATPADAPPAVRGFRDWAAQYLAAPGGERAALLARGEALAAAHTRELAPMIRQNPERALANAVPMAIRQDLPPSVVAQLEERIRTKGALEIYANVPNPDAPVPVEPYTRTFTTPDERRWNAFTFGQRGAQRTISATSVNGIAIAQDMAVADSLVRQLEIGERPVADGRPVTTACPVSGIETPVEQKPDGALPPITPETPAFETAERLVYVCSGGHITEVAERISAEEEREHWRSLGVELNAGGGSGSGTGPVGTVPGASRPGTASSSTSARLFPITASIRNPRRNATTCSGRWPISSRRRAMGAATSRMPCRRSSCCRIRRAGTSSGTTTWAVRMAWCSFTRGRSRGRWVSITSPTISMGCAGAASSVRMAAAPRSADAGCG